jgi:glycosyltransferase involved in cell wall biosynthesis
VVLEQTRRLRERGHEVRLFSPIIRWNKSFPQSLVEANPERIVPALRLPFPFREASAMIASSLLPFKMWDLADCDILLCHSQPSMWLGYRTKKLFGTPYVGYLHQLTTFIHKRPEAAGNWATKADFLLLDGSLGVFGRPIARHLDKMCHRNADKLLFNSAWTRMLFEREYGVGGYVCYPGIEVPAKPVELKRENMIITASRHYPWKRIDLAFYILKHLKESRPSLVVTGEETAHTPTLKRIALKMGLGERVRFTGFLEDGDLYSFYEHAKAYVQTSIYEPFGLGPLEAQSFGTPAVVWGDSGVGETVLNGESGFHAKPYDIEDFAGKLDSILSSREVWSKMSRAAKIWAATFNWETHVDLLERALDEQRR